MQKPFDSWNQTKKIVNEKNIQDVFYREREIWWCHLGVNVGYEQDGKHETFRRPVLVFKKFNIETFWAIPLTSKNKRGKYYYSFTLSDSEVINTANLSQLKLIDSKRLIDKMGYINENDYLKIKERIKKIIDNNE